MNIIPDREFPDQGYTKQDNSELLSTYSTTNNLLYKELNKLIDDDGDINRELEKIINPKIIQNLKDAAFKI